MVVAEVLCQGGLGSPEGVGEDGQTAHGMDGIRCPHGLGIPLPEIFRDMGRDFGHIFFNFPVVIFPVMDIAIGNAFSAAHMDDVDHATGAMDLLAHHPGQTGGDFLIGLVDLTAGVIAVVVGQGGEVIALLPVVACLHGRIPAAIGAAAMGVKVALQRRKGIQIRMEGENGEGGNGLFVSVQENRMLLLPGKVMVKGQNAALRSDLQLLADMGSVVVVIAANGDDHHLIAGILREEKCPLVGGNGHG